MGNAKASGSVDNGQAKLEVWFQYNGHLAAQIQTTGSKERLEKSSDFLGQLHTQLVELGLLTCSPGGTFTSQVVWGTGQMRCAWNVKKHSYKYHNLRWLMRVAWSRLSTSALPIAWVEFRENGETIPVINLPITPPSLPPLQSAKSGNKQLESIASQIPLASSNSTAQKRKREEDPTVSPRPGQQLSARNSPRVGLPVTSKDSETPISPISTQTRPDVKMGESSGAQASPTIESASTWSPISPIASFEFPNARHPRDKERQEQEVPFRPYLLQLGDVAVTRSCVLQTQLSKVRQRLFEERDAHSLSLQQAQNSFEDLRHSATEKERAWSAEREELSRRISGGLELIHTQKQAWAAEKSQLLSEISAERAAREQDRLAAAAEQQELSDMLSEQRDMMRVREEAWAVESQQWLSKVCEERAKHEALQEEQLAWAAERHSLLTELSEARAGHEAAEQDALNLRRQTDTEKARLESELQELREAQAAADRALETEREDRQRVERCLESFKVKGISPLVVPSLLDALARVAQLTDKVL